MGVPVDILDYQHDGRAGRHLAPGPFVREYTRHDFDRVGFLTLGGKTRLSGPPAIELALDVLRHQRDPRWTTVDDAADRRPMAFAEAGEPEEVAERIE